MLCALCTQQAQSNNVQVGEGARRGLERMGRKVGRYVGGEGVLMGGKWRGGGGHIFHPLLLVSHQLDFKLAEPVAFIDFRCVWINPVCVAVQ